MLSLLDWPKVITLCGSTVIFNAPCLFCISYTFDHASKKNLKLYLTEILEICESTKTFDFSHVPSGRIFEIRWLQKALQSRSDTCDDVTKRVTSSVTSATTLNQQINMIDVLSESHIRVTPGTAC
jgi:hypothetical protein